MNFNCNQKANRVRSEFTLSPLKIRLKKRASSVKTYKVVAGIPPVESMDEHGQDVARYQDKYHQRVHPHPLHGDGRPPVPIEVDQSVDSGEEKPRRPGGGKSVTYGVQ